MSEPQVMTETLGIFLELMADGHANLMGPALWFLKYFLVFETVYIGFLIAFDRIDIGYAAIKHLLLTGIIVFFIEQWPEWHVILRDSMIWLGMKASGSEKSIVDIFDPSALTLQGIELARPLISWASELSFRGALQNLFTISMCGLAVVIIVFSFFWIAIQVYVSLIEFYFVSMCFGVLLAFRLFSPTRWVSQGAIQSPVQHGAKLFTMAFVISMSERFITQLTSLCSSGEIPSFDESCMMALGSLTFMMVVIRLGGLAGSLISGTPSLSGADLTKAVGASAAGIAGTAVAGMGAAKAGVAGVSAIKQAGASGFSAATSMASGAISGATLGALPGQVSSNRREQIAGAIMGGVKGGVAASPLGKMGQQSKEKIASNFRNSVQSGRLSAWTATGGKPTPGMTSASRNLKFNQRGRNSSSQLKSGFNQAMNGGRSMWRAAGSLNDDHSSFGKGGK